MVFSSLIFVFMFLPAVLGVYYLTKEKYRNIVLLLFSLVFYAYGEPKFVFVMIMSIVANYMLALLIDRYKNHDRNSMAKCMLIMAIAVNLAILGIFKYLGFTETIINRLFRLNIRVIEIALPIGISFFTFQAMSYVIDVYRGDVKVQKNLAYLALYISFFPQLIAGPIVRYSSIEEQINHRTCNTEKFADGIRRFFLGFAKKIIIANNLSVVAAEVFGMDYQSTNPAILWLGSICFSLQIFFDFSGYSDMAIGLAKMFGFTLEENFDHPYMSGSVTEFWRRWHISLGRWFRDYVYIPLGGSRVSVPRYILNVFVVWLLTGIWHGANYTFIVWGLIHFVFLIIEKYIIKIKKCNKVFLGIWHIVTIAVINFSWILFNSSSIGNAINYIKYMLGAGSVKFSVDPMLIGYFREYGVFIALGVVFSTSIVPYINKCIEKNDIAASVRTVILPIAYGCVFLWAVSFLILGAHNPFIYFNF